MVKTIGKLFMVSMLFIMVSACASVPGIAMESAYIGYEIGSGKVMQEIKSAELGSIDEQIVTHAHNKAVEFKEKWKSVVDNPQLIVDADKEIVIDYADLKRSYLEAEAVVSRNWDKYSAHSKTVLLGYQDHAMKLDKSIGDFASEAERKKNAIQFIKYATAVASMAAGVVK